MMNGGHGFKASLRSAIVAPLMTASMNQATPESAFFINTSIGRGVPRDVQSSIAKSRARHTQATGIVLAGRERCVKDMGSRENTQESTAETEYDHDCAHIEHYLGGKAHQTVPLKRRWDDEVFWCESRLSWFWFLCNRVGRYLRGFRGATKMYHDIL